MVPDISRKRLPGLCLLFVGLTLCIMGGLADSPTNTYSIDQTETSLSNFAELPADAQRIVEEGHNGSESVTVEDVTDEFSPTRVTLVQYEGETFCVRAERGRESTQTPEETSSANQTVIVGDCTALTFDFESLSPRGKAVVSATLNDPDNRIELSQDLPPELYAGPGDTGRTSPPDGDEPFDGGNYYILNNGTVYHLNILGPGAWGNIGSGIGDILFIFGGFVFTLYGLLSSFAKQVYTPLVIVAGTSVYILPPVLSLVRLHRQSIWLNQQPRVLIAIALVLLTGLSLALYDRYQQNEET